MRQWGRSAGVGAMAQIGEARAIRRRAVAPPPIPPEALTQPDAGAPPRRPALPPPAAPPAVAPAAVRRAAARVARGLPARPTGDATGTGPARPGPAALRPDPRLIARIGAARCLDLGVAPLARHGGTVSVAVADAGAAARAGPVLMAAFGPWRAVAAPRAAIDAAVAAAAAGELARRAETRPDARDSCRGWHSARRLRYLPCAGFVLAVALLAAPVGLMTVLTLWAALALSATVALRGAALAMALRGPAPVRPPALPDAALPSVSVIVPLYREADIAARLLVRIGRIDYPRDRVEVILAVEADDDKTRAAVAAVPLPGWIRTVVVPPGSVRTKPRALNYALDFCRGSIVGVWDAEDAPAPDQLRRAAAAFAAAPADVACLQGVLDYYNPRTNWLSRCFAVEYAAWFRIVLPGLARLGAPLPLGGTTMFVRRGVLEAIGAWDAHNVTEDADLGIRLARRGWRTQMLDSTTEEEANCRAVPWVRQRSRWIKGHLITWAVHMRDPAALWRDLGPRGFLLYQAVFLGAQTPVLLAPLLWSFWVLAAGFGHPLAPVLGAGATAALIALFVLAEGLSVATGIAGARRTRHAGLWAWAPTLHLYHMLGALAGWRALAEAIIRPSYWAKTAHGLYDAAAPLVPPRVLTSPASIFSRVSNARLMWVRSAS